MLQYYIANIRYIKNGKTYFHNDVVVARSKDEAFNKESQRFLSKLNQYKQNMKEKLNADSIESIVMHKAQEVTNNDYI